MEKLKEVELRSLEDLKKLTEEAKIFGINVATIGGYGVRGYTHTRLRYSKDLDLAVKNKQTLNKFKSVLGKIGYTFTERPHGLSGYRKYRGVNISLNVIVAELDWEEREIKPYYNGEPIKVNVATLEEIFILKMDAFREKDIVDLTLLTLDAFQDLDLNKLKEKLKAKEKLIDFLDRTREITALIGTKEFRTIWHNYMDRALKKSEEEELWTRITSLTKKLER